MSVGAVVLHPGLAEALHGRLCTHTNSGEVLAFCPPRPWDMIACSQRNLQCSATWPVAGIGSR